MHATPITMVYAAALRAAARMSEARPGEGRKKPTGENSFSTVGFDIPSWAYIENTPFFMLPFSVKRREQAPALRNRVPFLSCPHVSGARCRQTNANSVRLPRSMGGQGGNPKGFRRGKRQDGQRRSVTGAKRQGTRCKEETQRVSDAENGKMGSDEALPERSDRERDEPTYRDVGRRAPTAPHFKRVRV